MKKFISYCIAFFTIIATFSSCTDPVPVITQVNGNGNFITEERNKTQFTSVAIYDNFETVIKEGDRYLIEIMAESNIIYYIETEVNELGVLTIKAQDNFELLPTADIVITIYTPEKVITADIYDNVILSFLDFSSETLTVTANNSSKLSFTNTSANDVSLVVTDAAIAMGDTLSFEKLMATIYLSGKMEMSSVDFSTLNVYSEGAGDCCLSGVCEKAVLKTVSSGDIDARNMRTMNCTVDLESSGDIYTNAVSTLEGMILSSGDLYVAGIASTDYIVIKGSGKIIVL